MEVYAPWIGCAEKGENCILAKDDKAYYIIKVGKRLDYATSEWLEHQGVSEELLKELQLPFEYIPRKLITGIAFSDFKAGGTLYLYLKKDKRVLTLGEALTKDRVRHFFFGIPRTHIPKEQLPKKKEKNWRKEKRDEILYKKLWWVSAALIFASLLVNFGYYRTGNPIWFTLCLLVLAVPVALDILMPGYFTIFFSEKNKKQDAWSLEVPLWISFVAMLMIRSPNILGKNSFWAFSGAAALGSVLLCLLAEEFRREPVWLLAAVVMGGLFGPFVLAHANVVYAPEEPQAYVLDVEETHKNGGKTTNYYCTVILPDGREESLSIPRKMYDALEEGDLVRVEVGEGFFGIEYANVSPLEEGE